MRVRRLTKKPWFEPKQKLGWGLTIASGQGAVVTLAASVLAIASVVLLQPLIVGVVAAAVVLVAFVIVALMTGDPPGGPRRSSPG
jgi:hypothetical protein